MIRLAGYCGRCDIAEDKKGHPTGNILVRQHRDCAGERRSYRVVDGSVGDVSEMLGVVLKRDVNR